MRWSKKYIALNNGIGKDSRHSTIGQLHSINVKGATNMKIVHTYVNSDPAQRLARQAVIHRKCFLLLRAVRSKG